MLTKRILLAAAWLSGGALAGPTGTAGTTSLTASSSSAASTKASTKASTTTASSAAGTPTMTGPVRYGVALFSGWEPLDVFGPLSVVNALSKVAPIELSLLSEDGHPVSTNVNRTDPFASETIVPTHTFAKAPELDVLIVPGGQGTRNETVTKAAIAFIRDRFPKTKYLLTVCTGAALAAQAGVLDGKNATTNKMSFKWVESKGPKVKWVGKARWVTDGNIWTSSGVSAGTDMMYAFVAAKYGENVADMIATRQEYVRITNSTDDPFATLV